MPLELESLRLKRKTDRSAGEGGEANQEGEACLVFDGAKSPDLLQFLDGKNNIKLSDLYFFATF